MTDDEIKALIAENSRLKSENFDLGLDLASSNQRYEKAMQTALDCSHDLIKLLTEWVFPLIDLFIAGRIIILPLTRPDLENVTMDDILKFRVERKPGAPFIWDAIKRDRDYYNHNFDKDFQAKWGLYQEALKPFGIKIPESVFSQMIERSKDTIHKYYK